MDAVPSGPHALPLRTQLHALRRLALAAVHPGGPTLYADLMAELCAALDVAVASVAVYTDDTCTVLRTLATRLDGREVAAFEYPVEGSPCANVRGRALRYVAAGVAAEFRAGTIFAARGMDSYAAVPLADSAGVPLGMVVVMDRRPVAGGDAEHTGAMLKIIAGRLAAEIERARTDEVFRATALAVSRDGGGSVFDELVRLLARLLGVEVAFVSRYRADDPDNLGVLAMVEDDQILHPPHYTVAGTPCQTVLGQRFRAYPRDLQRQFPGDFDARRQGLESYAGYPLAALDGSPLGVVAVASRRPLVQVERVEATLKIFAVRAAAEIERLAANDALQRSAASYRAIFEAAEDAIFIHDWDTGAILDVNAKAAEVYGWSRDEMKRMTVADFSSGEPPYTAADAAHWIRLAKLGRCPPFEWHRRNRDGSLHWDEVRLKPAAIEGRPHILAFTREITERKAALAELQAREEQYRTIFETASDGFVLWDENLTVVDANPAALRMYGYTREQVVGRGYPGDLPDAYVQERLDWVRRAMAGETIQVETTARRARGDGTFFDVDLRVMPFRHRGRPHVLAVVRDISERRERERALQRSEARLRATVEAAFDCVIGMDDEGRVVEFNQAAERVFGYPRHVVLGRMLADVILPPRHREAHARGLQQFHASGRGPMLGRLVETTALTADGREIPVELAISVATVPGGSIFVGHLRDISARRAAEAERAQLEAQLRQAQKMEAIGQLTGGIAHDFNNILTSIVGYLVMAEERAEAIADATLQRQLGQAHLAAQRARDLIAQMLAFARRQRGERRTLALAPLVRQTLQLLRSTLPSTVEIDTAGIAPAGDGPSVTADAVQLEQVLFNLCINARDAMGGHGRITVRLHTHDHAPGGWYCASCRARVDAGPWIELAVADSGTGVAPELLERIFDPFFSTKAPGQGSGMGLAMVHGIVHGHGGHLRLVTAAGQGAEFGVWLPLADAAAPGAAVAAPSPSGTPTLRGRVLVVEDDAMVGDFLAERLVAWGLDVTLQRDPFAAAAWLDDPAHEVDLLVTDQTMPQLTGLELVRQVRARRPRLPVVLVSANVDAVAADELAAAGVALALPKPIDAKRLRTALGELLATT